MDSLSKLFFSFFDEQFKIFFSAFRILAYSNHLSGGKWNQGFYHFTSKIQKDKCNSGLCVHLQTARYFDGFVDVPNGSDLNSDSFLKFF